MHCPGSDPAGAPKRTPECGTCLFCHPRRCRRNPGVSHLGPLCRKGSRAGVQVRRAPLRMPRPRAAEVVAPSPACLTSGDHPVAIPATSETRTDGCLTHCGACLGFGGHPVTIPATSETRTDGCLTHCGACLTFGGHPLAIPATSETRTDGCLTHCGACLGFGGHSIAIPATSETPVAPSETPPGGCLTRSGYPPSIPTPGETWARWRIRAPMP